MRGNMCVLISKLHEQKTSEDFSQVRGIEEKIQAQGTVRRNRYSPTKLVSSQIEVSWDNLPREGGRLPTK